MSSTDITTIIDNKITIKRCNSINDFRTEKMKDIIISKINTSTINNNNNNNKTTAGDSPASMKRSWTSKGKNMLEKIWSKIDKVGSTTSNIGINNDEDKSSSLINDNDDINDSKAKSNLVSIFKSKLSATKVTFNKIVKEQLDKRRTSLKSDE